MFSLLIPSAIAVGLIFLITTILAMAFRVVVSTNDVHIVQSRRRTVSYGKDQAAGNVYYAWPSWVPLFGIKIISLPVSVFDLQLDAYAAYDKGRVPFVIDIMAFFRIEDSNVAVLVRKQEAEEQVGVRTAQKDQQVGIAGQQAQQAVKEQEKTTAEKTMAVLQVQNVRQAEIERGVQVVAADQERQTAVIRADGEKQKTITVAEGALGAAKLHAEGVEVEGRAKGEAEKAVLLAPVQAQITLAKEIGANDGYQNYLIGIRRVEASQVVGVEQAKALAHADVKVISNVGSPAEGLTSVMDLFSAKGGTQLGAALEAIVNTPTGKAISEKLGINGGATHQ